MDNCVVSVAFREPYLTHSKAQEAWIRSNDKIDYVVFRDKLPIKGGVDVDDVVGTFQKSLYGFKPHAIQSAVNAGYKKVIWLDPSIMPVDSLDVITNALDEFPILVSSGDAPITKMSSVKARNWFGLEPEDLTDVKHVGGTIYAFNFYDQKAIDVFELWKKAEEQGIFGTQQEFMEGHWADEACMALALHKCGMKQSWVDFKYLNQKEL